MKIEKKSDFIFYISNYYDSQNVRLPDANTDEFKVFFQITKIECKKGSKSEIQLRRNINGCTYENGCQNSKGKQDAQSP